MRDIGEINNKNLQIKASEL